MRLGVFKKVAKFVGGGVLCVSAGIGIGLTTFTIKSCYKDNELNNYYKNEVSDPEQVKLLFSETGADSRWINNLNLRLGNNGDKPVYVSFDDAFNKASNKDVLDTTKEVLDDFFDILHSVNSRYTYTILPDSELTQKKYGDKAVIKFYYKPIEQNDESDVYASVQTQQKWKLFTLNDFANDPETREKARETTKLKHILWHEFGHIEGLEDVYDFKLPHPESVVDTKFIYAKENNTNMLTPNDYACMLSMFTPNMNDLELANFIETIPEKIDAYKNKYYTRLSESLLENKGEDRNKYVFPQNFENGTFGITTISNYPEKYVNISVNNNEYTATVYERDNTISSSCSGKVYKTNRHIFFDNMYFETGLSRLTGDYYGVAHYQSMALSAYDDYFLLQDIVGKINSQSEEKISNMKQTKQSAMLDYYNLDSFNLLNWQ